MIGRKYKKFAENRGLVPFGGVAYGEIGGFMTTLSEGMGNKDLFVTLSFPDEQIRLGVAGELNGLRARYGILRLEVTDRFVYVSFQDTIGTLKRIEGFMAWFYPYLTGAGARGVSHCPVCREPLSPEERTDKLINDSAYALHTHCAEQVRQEIGAENQAKAEEKPNYGRGAFGAIVGGMVGAIPWAIVYSIGFFAGWLGFLIGFLALKGYTWFGGRLRKPTIYILLCVIVFSVFFAQFLGDGFNLGYLILSGELPGFELTDIPWVLFLLISQDLQYQAAFALNVILGLAFALWGAFGLFRKVAQEAKAQKLVMTDLPAPARQAIPTEVR